MAKERLWNYCKGVKTWKTKKETLNTINVKIVIIMLMDNVFGIHTKLIKMVGVKIILDIKEGVKYYETIYSNNDDDAR